MNVVNDRIKTEYGWSMNIPAGWERLGEWVPGVMALTQAIVFAKSDETSISLTWMVRSYPVTEETVAAFTDATIHQEAPDGDTVAAIVNSIFPLIGNLDNAFIGTLADGTRVIETLESYAEGQIKCGYQMLMPLNLPDDYSPTFQRICFYAPQDAFERYLPDVRSAARSFRYDRPFGIKR
jgi:hypothetical protein